MDAREYLKYAEHWLTSNPGRHSPAIAQTYAAIALAIAAERQADALERIAAVLERITGTIEGDSYIRIDKMGR